MNTINTNWKVLSKLKTDFISNIKFICIFGETGDEVIVVTKENNFYSFGSNRNGCLGLGHNRPIDEPTKVLQLSNQFIIDISYGYNHVIALLKTGICYGWGRNDCGQLGIGSFGDSFEPKLIQQLIDQNLDIIAISCGAYHSLVLTQTGDVYSFGNNIWGQLGYDSSERSSTKPKKILGFDNHKVVSISCGYNHSLCLTDNGLVYSWGHNSYGELGIGSNEHSFVPIRVPFLYDIIKKIVCGFGHSLLLSSDGYIYGFGYNHFGQLGCSVKINQNIPIKIGRNLKFKEIATNFFGNISVALTENNICYVWGQCCHEIISIPRKSDYKSIHEIFANYSKHKITYKPMFIDKELTTNAITDSISQLFDNEKYSDIHFKVRNQTIFAHKLILKTRCNYFDSLLSENWSESHLNEIQINDYSYDIYYAFIKYIYTDLVDVEIDKAFDLLDLADFYCEEKLINKCYYIIKSGLNIENVCNLYISSVEHNSNHLIKYCLKFISDNIKEIRLTKAFSQINQNLKNKYYIFDIK